MVRRVRADRERQPMAIHNRHDFHAFSALRWSDFRPATFGHNERRIDEAFFFIQRAVFTKLVGNVRQNQTQNLVAAPSLKASMHSFVVRIALLQHVPLRTCVENPQNHDESESACVQHAHREYAPPENASECAPTVRPSAESFLIYSGSTAIGDFEIASRLFGYLIVNACVAGRTLSDCSHGHAGHFGIVFCRGWFCSPVSTPVPFGGSDLRTRIPRPSLRRRSPHAIASVPGWHPLAIYSL